MCIPRMKHHRGLNQAYAAWKVHGKKVFRYFGRWGSRSSRVKYIAFLNSWPESRLATRERSEKWPARRLLTFEGCTQSIAKWSAEIGVKATTIRYRLDVKGWTVEQALTMPVKKWTRQVA